MSAPSADAIAIAAALNNIAESNNEIATALEHLGTTLGEIGEFLINKDYEDIRVHIVKDEEGS